MTALRTLALIVPAALALRGVLIMCVLTGLAAASAGCSSDPPPPPAQASQATAQPAAQNPSAAAPAAAPARSKETRKGRASYIAKRLDGRKTASGAIYDGSQLVAAHPTYPMGTILRVTNEENGRVVEVKIIDRSASGATHPIIDLSRAAAERLDFIKQGTVRVTTEAMEWGPAGTRK